MIWFWMLVAFIGGTFFGFLLMGLMLASKEDEE